MDRPVHYHYDDFTRRHYAEEELLQIADRYLAHNYHPPDKIFCKGNGSLVSDLDGTDYYDLNSCYSALPFGHLTDELDTFPRAFHCPDRILFARELAEFCAMDMVCPMNTGAEAVETAIKLARKWAYIVKKVTQDKAEIIVCENNFHGRTTTIVGFSSNPQYKNLFGPYGAGFKTIPFGDAEALKNAITPNTAAFLVEPIQGEGGIIIPPRDYLEKVRKTCWSENVLLVLDEIQTGLGRTGFKFAYNHEVETKPDVLILGKALGGGRDNISAVVSSRDIMGVFEPGDHGSTFGGNPKACRSARHFMRDFQRLNLAKNAREQGQYFLRKLQIFSKSKISIKEVRGRGLFIAIEFNPGPFDAIRASEQLLKAGLLTVVAKSHILRLSPPLNITKIEIDKIMKRFRAAEIP